MNQTNQLTSFLARTIAVLVLTTFVSTTARAVSNWFSGGCKLTLDGYVLTVSKSADGDGYMDDYSNLEERPWNGSVSSITSIVIESGVTHIGGGAFFDCCNASITTIPSSVTSIGGGAFSGCTGLTSITIPASVKSIGEGAFSDCTGLTSVTFAAESQLETIGDYAFGNCNNASLTSITIPASVTSIGGSAFYNCTGLTSITIPASVTTIGSEAFNKCTGLTSINVDANNANYASEDGVLFNKTKTTIIQYPKSKSGTAYTIPASVTSIGGWAFSDCTGLTSITIPASVTSIGKCAFWNCNNTNLTSIEIPASVTEIKDLAFYGCTNLASVTVYATSCSLGGSAFDNCSSGLQIYVFSDLVNTYKGATNWIGYRNKITAITPDQSGNCGATGDNVKWELAGTVFHISGTGAMADYDAFNPVGWNNDKSNITSIVIEDGVTHIGNAAFFECNNASLTSITIPSSVTSIGNSAFRDCTGLTSITIPSSVTTIGYAAFMGCTSLSSVTFSDGVKTIGDQAFEGCIGLTSLTIPTSVTTIGYQTFNGCSNLTTVIIGSGLTSIADKAFKDCTNLTTFTLYALSCSLEGINVFYGCSNIYIYVFEDKVTDYQGTGSWAFYIRKISAIPDLKVNDAGGKGHWCSYYNELADVTVADGTAIYTAKYNSTTQKVTLTQVDGDIVKKGEAVLLKNTMGCDITLSSAASSGSGDYSDNELKGGTTVTSGYDAYTLSRGADGNGDMGFYKFNGASLDGSKAHLELPQSAPSPSRGFIGFDDDETTGMSDASHLMDNGEWIMDNEAGAWYDLSGRKLAGQPTKKGIYVRDGKKFIVK